MLAALRARGIELQPGPGRGFSGVHGVLIRDGRVDGGYDPRREGVVLAAAGALGVAADRFGDARECPSRCSRLASPSAMRLARPGPS